VANIAPVSVKLLVTLHTPQDADRVRATGVKVLADYPDTLLVRATPAERQLLQAQKLEAVELEHPPRPGRRRLVRVLQRPGGRANRAGPRGTAGPDGLLPRAHGRAGEGGMVGTRARAGRDRPRGSAGVQSPGRPAPVAPERTPAGALGRGGDPV